MGLYLLGYSLLNFARIAKALFSATTCAEALAVFVRLNTPMLGGWSANTSIVLIVSVILMCYAYRDFLIEFEELFLSGGQYVTMAENYHRTAGNIAVSVWGRVLQGDQDAPNVTVGLSLEGSVIETTQTDNEGRFQFAGRYAECLTSGCAIILSTDSESRTIAIADKQVPSFEFRLPSTPAEVSEPKQ